MFFRNVMLGLSLLAVSACQNQSEPENDDTVSPASTTEAPSDERLNELIDAGQRLIKMQLTDPYSAQFENMKTTANRDILCGQVNSKNQMGGYEGARDFVYDRTTGDALIQPFLGVPDTGSMSEFELKEGVKNTQSFAAAFKRCGSERVPTPANGG